jgi:surface antigen
MRARLIAHQKTVFTDRLHHALKRKATRRRVVRYGLLGANVLILGIVISFIVASSNGDTPTVANAFSAAGNSDDTVNPVDRLTSYDIAANIAERTSLPEKTAINNQAQSARVSLAVMSTSSANVVAKPQIVATALKSRQDIRSYVVQAGDTVTSIAQKFGVTSDSVRWSNGLNGDVVNAGVKLFIPPVNGIVYTVKSGDTVQSLATKFRANADQITAYNDAELSGIKVGEQIIIPGGQQPRPVVTPVASSFRATYGANGYDYGYCTWYVATQIAIPSNWGNANTWAYYAALSGWTVSSTPRVGAIAQTSRGYEGHVAMVQDVSPDGSQVLIRDMNGIAGWGRVGVAWEPTSRFEHYIFH